MAESDMTIVRPEEVQTGNQGVLAYKNERIVQLRIATSIGSSRGWKKLCTTPDELKPMTDLYYVLPDTNADRDGIQIHITTSEIAAYSPGTGSYAVNGIVVYFSAT